jgi:hypothetical protein
VKILRTSGMVLALALLSSPLIRAQDLSEYRNFSLGSSLATISKQLDALPAQVVLLHQSPKLIEELRWWPIESRESSARAETVEQIQFSFCDRALYKIVATYEGKATKGMTAEDMVQAVSATYGRALRPGADVSTSVTLSYSVADTQIALWENDRYSASLSRSPLMDSFQLTLLSKQLNNQAEAGIAEAVKQEAEGGPQRETARLKKEADDLAAMREANLKSFRP